MEDRDHIIPDCIAKGDDSLAYSSLLGRQMLTAPLRDYVIKDIKRPLQKVLELVVRRFRSKFGKITPDKVMFRVTHNLMEIWDFILSCHKNSGRDGIFEATRDVSLWEVEHDPYYRHIFEVMVEKLVEQVINGEWEPRLEGYPYHQWWDEPEPHGGKHSIIAQINAHKGEIQTILKGGVMEVKEENERCSCGGEIDSLYLIEPGIWQGRCFQCGIKYTVIKKGVKVCQT